MNRLVIPNTLHVVAVASCVALAACRGSGEEATAAMAPAAREPLDEAGGLHVNAGDRCPVCAMEVREHAPFASAIQLQDGRTFYFCGTGCMIRSWLHPEVFLGVGRDELRRAAVKEYFGGEPVDASEAIFVAGSDVVGPMGPALVPLRSQADVETFRARHGGRTTFRMSELDDDRWQAITGKNVLAGRRR
jgi:nitrous oxide reductase accessory protein NosL